MYAVHVGTQRHAGPVFLAMGLNLTVLISSSVTWV